MKKVKVYFVPKNNTEIKCATIYGRNTRIKNQIALFNATAEIMGAKIIGMSCKRF